MTDDQLVRLLYLLCLLGHFTPEDSRRMANEAMDHPTDDRGWLAEPHPPEDLEI